LHSFDGLCDFVIEFFTASGWAASVGGPFPYFFLVSGGRALDLQLLRIVQPLLAAHCQRQKEIRGLKRKSQIAKLKASNPSPKTATTNMLHHRQGR